MSCFIQTADIHIGACRSLEGYLERHKSVLQQINEIAFNEKIPLIIAGDLTDNRTTTHDERLLLSWWLGDIERKKIPTIVICGNHDHLYGEVTQLDGFKHMPFTNIKLVTWHPDIEIIGDTGFICIPWRGYSSEELSEIVLEKLPLISSCKYKVVIAHECITGVKTDSGRVLTKGASIPKGMSDITYWALGDIHKSQKANVSNAYYCGTPAQWSFDQELPKGVLKVDLECPSKKPELIPIQSKPLKVIHSIKEIKEDAYYKLIGGYEEVIKANKEHMVVRTEYDSSKEITTEYTKVGIVDGLNSFLADKGICEDLQKKAICWVSDLLKLEKTDEVVVV